MNTLFFLLEGVWMWGWDEAHALPSQLPTVIKRAAHPLLKIPVFATLPIILVIAVFLPQLVEEAFGGLDPRLPLGGIALADLWFITRAYVTKEYRLGDNLVIGKRSGLGVDENWTEPLANYRGLRLYRHSKNKRDNRALHVLYLDHPERNKRVPLFISHSQDAVQEGGRRYAKLLGLPEWAD